MVVVKSSKSALEPYNPGIEHTFTNLNKRKNEELRKATTLIIDIEQTNKVPMATGDDEANEGANLTLRDYVVLKFDGDLASIRRPRVNANNFEIKPTFIIMIQMSIQFGGLPDDDPHAHLAIFYEIYDTLNFNRMTDDTIHLRLSPFFSR